jgi:hypothetical protein
MAFAHSQSTLAGISSGPGEESGLILASYTATSLTVHVILGTEHTGREIGGIKHGLSPVGNLMFSLKLSLNALLISLALETGVLLIKKEGGIADEMRYRTNFHNSLLYLPPKFHM